MLSVRIFSVRAVRLLGFSCIILFLASCRDDSGAPDVSGLKVSLNARRFDRDLAQVDTMHIAQGLLSLKQRYPDFLDFWLDDLMQFGVKGVYDENTPAVRGQLRQFLTYRDFRGLFDTVARHFPDTKSIDGPLQRGFQYYRHYYPQRSVPKVIYFVSGLNNWSAITLDSSIVGIGLDMFLGADYPFYKSVGIPEYISRSLVPESAPVKAFKAVFEESHPFVAENKNLLEMMVQRGMEQYFLTKMLPFVPEHVRLGFTGQQLNWCKGNEALVYNFFVKGGFLYETNWGKILRYVNDAPEATGMPPESPGNVGSWLGLQMINAYMAKHPAVTLEQLFSIQDAQIILQGGQYKPR